MIKTDCLIVASHAKWVYRDFANNYTTDIPVLYSHGYGIPDYKEYSHPAFWTPTAHAARLKACGLELPLLAPGPDWLPRVPDHLKGRSVWSMTLGELRDDPIAIKDETLYWIKLAEMKDDRLPTQRTYLKDFITTALSLGAPDGTVIQFSDGHLNFVKENRFFIVDHKVWSGSPYMIQNDLWDADREDDSWNYDQWASDFARYVATTCKSFSPRAYTLDIGQVMPDDLVGDDYHVVIEANPIWSSAIYGSDPEITMLAIMEGIDYNGTEDHHWKPDPWLVQKAEYQVALKPE